MSINMCKGQTANLGRQSGRVSYGFMTASFDWEIKRGLFGALKNVDIVFGMLYELKDGTKGVVHTLDTFGSISTAPWFEVDREARTRGITRIQSFYDDALQNVQRVGLFVGINKGASSLKNVKNATTTVGISGKEWCVIRHEGNAHSTRFCAIALLTNTGNSFNIRMDVQPIIGNQTQVDAYWGWGLGRN
ncbi:hypothetical protein [Shimazuella kribbensis]|uniref:hypothetical protein n=1 Tax=Shimazuella kribbensis TaxID=139808 RepID=UPI000419D268|nr:hypothetical protein [Shimazuella kribbensis]